MNEKLQYATMLDIPVNTSSVTYKTIKKKRGRKKTVDPEAVKEKLVNKINSETVVDGDNGVEKTENAVNSKAEAVNAVRVDRNDPVSAEKLYAEAIGGKIKDTTDVNVGEKVFSNTAEKDISAVEENFNGIENAEVSASVHGKSSKKSSWFGVIGVELAAIAVLIASIFLTNAFYDNSAINVFMKRVFSPQTETVEQVKTYDEFSPVFKYDDVTVDNGVTTVAHGGAVYSPVNGTVESVEKTSDGLYTMTIAHSGAFYSTVSGLKYAYLIKGDAVYGAIPVGYAESGYKTVFATADGTITDYTVDNGAVKWA